MNIRTILLLVTLASASMPSFAGTFLYVPAGHGSIYYETTGGLENPFYSASQSGAVNFFEVFTGKEIIPSRDNILHIGADCTNATITFSYDIYWIPSSPSDTFPGNPTIKGSADCDLAASVTISAGDHTGYKVKSHPRIYSIWDPTHLLTQYDLDASGQYPERQTLEKGTHGWIPISEGENDREAVVSMQAVGDGTYHGVVNANTNPLYVLYKLDLAWIEDPMPSSADAHSKFRLTITSLG